MDSAGNLFAGLLAPQAARLRPVQVRPVRSPLRPVVLLARRWPRSEWRHSDLEQQRSSCFRNLSRPAETPRFALSPRVSFRPPSGSRNLLVPSASIRILPPKPERLQLPQACPSRASVLLHLPAGSPDCPKSAPADQGCSCDRSALPPDLCLVPPQVGSSQARMGR